MNPVIYSLTFMPYLILSLAIFYSSMGTRRYSLGQMFKGQLLSFITLPVYMRASLFALAGVKGKFDITAKSGDKTIPYYLLWPQILLWAVCLAAITWGFNRFIYERTTAILINVVWIIYHFLLLSSIFYFNEIASSEIVCFKLKKGVQFDYKNLHVTIPAEDLSKMSWENLFSVELPEKFERGTSILCKVGLKGADNIVFEGVAIHSSDKMSRKGYATEIGISTIAEQDKKRLKGVLRK
jgi:hypothetical protein